MWKGIAAVSLLFILVIGVSGYSFQESDNIEPPNTTVVAFDYDGRHADVTADRLLSGDAVIFLKITGPNEVFFFNSLDELAVIDNNHDGFIDLNSPGYKQLYVGRYMKKNNTVTYQSFQDSGIAGIRLHYDNGKVLRATAILSDSSRRKIELVPINESYFNNAKLQDSKKMNIPQ